jgi:hypothetical protein
VAVITLLVGVLCSASVSAASPEPSPDPLEATVRHVAGGLAPSTGDIHQIWAQIMAASARDRMVVYAAPDAVTGYVGGEIPETPCSLATNIRFWRENARYCDQDATILFDRAWLRELSDRFGAFAPAAVLAHEWGHHVQRFTGPVQPGLRAELQADCFAGMYLGETEGLNPDGTYTIRDDALETALFSLFSLGDSDYRESQWFQPGLHGSPQQRILAFVTGYATKSLDRGELRSEVNGLDWCLGYSEFEPAAFVDIGPYKYLAAPGRSGAWLDDTYVVRSKADAVFASSDLRLRWVGSSHVTEGATHELLAEQLAAWLPEADLSPLGALAVRTGSGVAASFIARDGPGLAALVTPVEGDGALLIVASRPWSDVSVTNEAEYMAVFLEQVVTVNQVVNRLCGPDDSADPTLDSHNYVCVSELQ